MRFNTTEFIKAKRKCITISCSSSEHQETLKLTKRVIYMNNGINTEELDGMLEKVEHSFTVFMLGRICYQKNPRLFNSITKAMPDDHFLWIRDRELRDELKIRNIEITGWIDKEKALSFSWKQICLFERVFLGTANQFIKSNVHEKLCVVSDVIGNHEL